MSNFREKLHRKNVRGTIGAIIATVILAGIFIQPLSSAAYNVNLTAADPSAISQPLQTNAPHVNFNVGIQLQASQNLIINELQAVLDGQSGSPIRFLDTGAPVGSPDSRVSLQQGSNFPAQGIYTVRDKTA